MGNLSDALPPTLNKLLNDNIDAKDYFTNMDDVGKSELINYAKDFKSKEELERYIYYLTDDTFK